MKRKGRRVRERERKKSREGEKEGEERERENNQPTKSLGWRASSFHFYFSEPPACRMVPPTFKMSLAFQFAVLSAKYPWKHSQTHLEMCFTHFLGASRSSQVDN